MNGENGNRVAYLQNEESTLDISAHLPDFVHVSGHIRERCQPRKDGFWLDHSDQPSCSVPLLSGRRLQFEGAVPIAGHF